MITKNDIEKLASLARIKIPEEEKDKLTQEVGSILEYVGQIKEVLTETDKENFKEILQRNVFRDDEVSSTTRQYTEKLLQNSPSRDGDFVKVKKIL